MPTMPGTAFAADAEVPPGGGADAPLPWITWTPYTYPFNITGQPAITLPCGLAAEGLPAGLQIVGPWAHDARVPTSPSVASGRSAAQPGTGSRHRRATAKEETRMRTAVCLQGVDAPRSSNATSPRSSRLGYDTLWLTDSSLHSRNCWAYLTLAARASARLALGTAVTNPVTRHPGVTAVAAATVAEISGGRVPLGIGAGDRPLLSVGEQPAQARRPGDGHRGDPRAVGREHVARGAGFALDDAHYRFAPAPDIPVWISATGPKTLELAGRVADGVILLAGLHPDGIKYALDHIDRAPSRPGARAARGHRLRLRRHRRRGRGRPPSPRPAPSPPGSRRPSPVYCEIAGLPAELVEQVRTSYSGGEFQEAARAAAPLPADFVHRMALAGGSAEARQHIRDIAALGIDSITVFPLGARRMKTAAAFSDLCCAV